MAPEENRYMDLLSIHDEAAVLPKIKQLASDLSDKEHLIRSCIFDLHAAVEIELRRIFFFHFETLLFLTGNKEENSKVKKRFEKMIDRIQFLEMWKILRCVMVDWAPDFENIPKINETRNQAAHGEINKVFYKDRSPFKYPDCLCQMYFDVWAIKQKIPDFFDKMRLPYYQCREYYKKYGYIAISEDTVKEIDSFYDEH